jgi:membrane protease YdiL (CAAX protease family)
MTAIPNTAEDTVFTLLQRSDLRASRQQWLELSVLTLVAWLGTTAFFGRYRPSEVARAIEAAIPGDAFSVILVVAVALVALGAVVRRTKFASGAAIVAAFLAGNLLYEQLYVLSGLRFPIPLTQFSDALHFSAARLLWAVAALATTLPVWFATFGRQRNELASLTFRWGDWSVAARDFSSKQPPQRYGRMLLGGYLVVMLLLFLLMQASIGFRPIRSGLVIALLPGILVCAVANSLSEELLFRGVFQPAFMRVGGIAAGLWAQGAFFGLVHWGTSVGVLAALPVSLGIGLGSVMWGKATLETGGLGWVIVAHAMIDVAVMAAYFV